MATVLIDKLLQACIKQGASDVGQDDSARALKSGLVRFSERLPQMLDDQRILASHSFVENIDFKTLEFDLEKMHCQWDRYRDCPEEYRWSFDTNVLHSFHTIGPRENTIARNVGSSACDGMPTADSLASTSTARS